MTLKKSSWKIYSRRFLRNNCSKIDAPVKSVDNAIQRIRKKTVKNIQTESNI